MNVIQVNLSIAATKFVRIPQEVTGATALEGSNYTKMDSNVKVPINLSQSSLTFSLALLT